MDFHPFPKIPRLHREVVITEKIDGTNALVHIEDKAFGEGAGGVPDGVSVVIVADDDEEPMSELWIRAGSRRRWITPEADYFGFARWVRDNANELARLGPGSHYGEWFGAGIQRRYGLSEKRFALFNTSRWEDPAVRPKCCDVVPVIEEGNADTLNYMVHTSIQELRNRGSVVVPGFRDPEGIVVFHTASNHLYKVTLEDDAQPKSVGLMAA